MLQITGKQLHLVDVQGWLRQSETAIEISSGPDWSEAVVHEVCHWVVSPHELRAHPDNLGMGHSSDGYDGGILTARQMERLERMACRLEGMLFVLAGDPAGAAQGCGRHRMTAPLPEADRELVLQEEAAVGWGPLVELVAAVARAR